MDTRRRRSIFSGDHQIRPVLQSSVLPLPTSQHAQGPHRSSVRVPGRSKAQGQPEVGGHVHHGPRNTSGSGIQGAIGNATCGQVQLEYPRLVMRIIEREFANDNHFEVLDFC